MGKSLNLNVNGPVDDTVRDMADTINEASQEKLGRPIKDMTDYAIQTLHKINLLMDQYRKQGYVEIELSGPAAVFLSSVKIKLPEKWCS